MKCIPGTILAIATGIAISTGVARAQRAVTIADSATVRQNAFQILFKGITVTSVQRAQAERVISQTFAQQMALGTIDTCPEWKRAGLLQALRDSTLRTLIVADSDRVKFDRNVAKTQPTGTIHDCRVRGER